MQIRQNTAICDCGYNIEIETSLVSPESWSRITKELGIKSSSCSLGMIQVARIDEYNCQPTDFKRLAQDYGEILAVSVAISPKISRSRS